MKIVTCIVSLWVLVFFLSFKYHLSHPPPPKKNSNCKYKLRYLYPHIRHSRNTQIFYALINIMSSAAIDRPFNSNCGTALLQEKLK